MRQAMTFTVIVVMVFLAQSAVPETRLLLRDCGEAGDDHHQTIALLGPKVEFWAFNIDSQKKVMLEAALPLQSAVRSRRVRVWFAEALAWTPGNGGLYAKQILSFKGSLLGGELASYMADYVPLQSNVPNIFFSNDTAFTYEVGSGVRAGVAAHWWKVAGKPWPVHTGFKITGKATGGTTWTIRWCPFGGGGQTVYTQMIVPLR